MTTRKFFIITLLSVLVGMSIMGIHNYIKEYPPRCGVIVHSSEQLKQIKYATKHNMYFTVRYGDSYKDEQVTTHVFLTNKIGDNICFKSNYVDYNPKMADFYFWVFIVTFFLISAIIIWEIIT